MEGRRAHATLFRTVIKLIGCGRRDFKAPSRPGHGSDPQFHRHLDRAKQTKNYSSVAPFFAVYMYVSAIETTVPNSLSRRF